MRKIGLVLVVLALAVGFGMPAQAGPANGKPVGLYVAEYPDPAPGGGNSEIIKPREKVGSVLFRPKCGKMLVKITLRGVEENTTFRVFLVHLDTWGTLAEQNQWLTTDASGDADLCFSRPIPEDVKNNVFIKAIVRVSRAGPVYVTEQHHIPLNKK